MDREALRKDLEALQVLALSPGSADFMQSVSHLSENYWMLHVLAELRTGQTVDEVLSRLNDVQMENIQRAIKQSFQMALGVVMFCCAIADVMAQIQEHQDGTETK